MKNQAVFPTVSPVDAALCFMRCPETINNSGGKNMKKMIKNLRRKALSLILSVTVASGTLIMVPVASASAAETDNAPVNAAASNGGVSIEKFESDTNSIPVGETKTVTFKATVSGVTNSADNELKVIDSDQNVVGYMYDNGTNGDGAASDGTYTMQAKLSSDEAKTVSFYASANGSSGPSVNIEYFIPTTEAEWNAMHVSENKIESCLNSKSYKQKSESEKAAAVDELLDKMVSSGEIKGDSIFYDEKNRQYYFEYASSTPGVIMLKDFDEKYNSPEDASDDTFVLSSDSDSSVINAGEDIALEPISESEAMKYITQGGAEFNGGVTESKISDPVGGTSSKKALVLNGFENSLFRRDYYDDLKTEWDSKGLTTTVDVDVTVDDMKRFGSYDVSVISMHGSDIQISSSTFYYVIVLNQTVTSSTDARYDYEINTRGSVIKAYSGGTPVYLIRDIFFTDSYSSTALNGKLIFSETCEFYGADTHSTTPYYGFANAIYGRGAGAVIGYHNSVLAVYSRDVMKYVVDQCYAGTDVTTALNNAKSRYGATDGQSEMAAYPILTPTGSTFVLGGGSTPTPTYETITLNSTKTVNITTAGDLKYYKFTPTSATTINFFSTGDYDTYGYMFSSGLSELASDDDSGDDRNFKISYAVSANTTYILACKFYSSSATGSFTVKLTGTTQTKSISNCTITLGTTKYSFTNTAKTPSVTVKDGSTTLTKNTDYTVKYENNVNVGTAKAIVSGMGNYTGSVTKTFTIAYDSISLNTAKTVNITNAGTVRYYKFTPTAAMTVQFYSTGDCDTYGYVYNSSLSQLASDDDSGDNRNFKISYSLSASTTYIFSCKLYSSSATGSFTIMLKKNTKPISDCTVTLSATSFSYTGTAKTPSVTVKDGSTTLTKNTHYTVKYENNTAVGTAKAIVTGKGNYSGSVTKTFKIAYDTIALSTAKTVNISKAGTVRYYKFKPSSAMTVQFYSTGECDTYGYVYNSSLSQLASDDDSGDNRNFKISYSLSANTTYIFSCKLYNSSATGSFTIMLKKNTKPISDCTVTLSATSCSYTGTAKTPTVTVKDGSKTLTKNTDYTVKYENNTAVGTAKVTVTGKGSYTGSVTKSFKIVYDSITLGTARTVNISKAGAVRYFKLTATADMNIVFYSTGSLDTYGIMYDYKLTKLKNDNDSGDSKNFKMTYSLVAKKTYIFACKLYSSSATGSFSVMVKKNPKSLSSCTVTLGTTSYSYTGTAKTPGVTVKDGSKTLKKDTDFTVKYADNVEVGTGKVTVTGKGNYTGSVTKTFKITYNNITPGSTKDVNISQGGLTRYFKYTAASDMKVQFYSTGSLDTYGHLYNYNRSSQLATDDDSGDNRNFSITYSLKSGKTYIFAARLYGSSSTGTFSVSLVKKTNGADVELTPEAVSEDVFNAEVAAIKE